MRIDKVIFNLMNLNTGTRVSEVAVFALLKGLFELIEMFVYSYVRTTVPIIIIKFFHRFSL